MEEKELKDVFEKEFDRVYAVAYLAGFVDGALEGAKQQMAKEKQENARPSEPHWTA